MRALVPVAGDPDVHVSAGDGGRAHDEEARRAHEAGER